jgi:hypothetical protein
LGESKTKAQVRKVRLAWRGGASVVRNILIFTALPLRPYFISPSLFLQHYPFSAVSLLPFYLSSCTVKKDWGIFEMGFGAKSYMKKPRRLLYMEQP